MNDFGGKLRQARERRGVSLRQIAASTKISVGALEALERNDVSRLPGGIFSRAFVRSYAAEVGLDPDATVREFLERFGEDSTHAPATAAAAPDAGFESQQAVARTLLAIAAVSIVAIGTILYVSWPGRPTGSVANAPPAAVPAPPAAPQAAVDLPVRKAGGESLAAPAAEGFLLELHPTAPCWISLRVDGEPQFSRVVDAGERISRRVREVAVLEVGDAAAFAYTIDGRPGRPLGAAGQVRRAQITPASLSEYLR
jgi:transcriptional regulator with XRE-family HTH domain